MSIIKTYAHQHEAPNIGTHNASANTRIINATPNVAPNTRTLNETPRETTRP
jgi:hypothetical protein